MTSRLQRMRPARLLPVLAVLLSLFLPSESSAFIRRDLSPDASFLAAETCRNVPVAYKDPTGEAPEWVHRLGIWLDKKLGLDEMAAQDEADYVSEHLTRRECYIAAAPEPVLFPTAVLSNPPDRTPGMNDRRVAAHDAAWDLLYGLSGAGLADQLRVATGDEPVLQQSAGQLMRESFGYWNAGLNENSAAYQNTYLGLMGATFLAQVVLEKSAPTGTRIGAGRNPVPRLFARRIPVDLARRIQAGENVTLRFPTKEDVFVTAARDVSYLKTSRGASKRLTLVDQAGQLVNEPAAIVIFTLPKDVGIASPVFRSEPGFVGLGRTAGNAREFVIPNKPIYDLGIDIMDVIYLK